MMVLSSLQTPRGRVLVSWSSVGTLVVLLLLTACSDPLASTESFSNKSTKPPTLRVLYEGNHQTEGSVPQDGKKYQPGAQVDVLANTGALARTGFTFAGWNTAADGSGTVYPGGSSLPLGNSTMTLYAFWTMEPTFSVTYSNGETSGPVPVDGNNYPPGSMVPVLGNPGNLTLAGSLFIGWNTAADSSGTTLLPTETFSMGSQGETLFAMWMQVIATEVDNAPNAARIVLPEGITSLTTGAFGSALVELTLPSTVDSIQGGTFENSLQLQSITVAAGNSRFRAIGGALVDISSETLFLVPPRLAGPFTVPSVQTIGGRAFENCANLTSISIPNSVVEIQSGAFANLTSPGVTALIIPASVTTVGDQSFIFASSVKDIFFQSLSPPVLQEAVSNHSQAFGAGQTIHVPSSALAAYQSAPVWSEFSARMVSP